jgi:ribosomal protein L40E
MWDVLDFVARLICLGGFVFLGWSFYQITRKPSARNNFGYNSFPVTVCMKCGKVLGAGRAVHCDECLGASNV